MEAEWCQYNSSAKYTPSRQNRELILHGNSLDYIKFLYSLAMWHLWYAETEISIVLNVRLHGAHITAGLRARA
jgi:hypothetical protein